MQEQFAPCMNSYGPKTTVTELLAYLDDFKALDNYEDVAKQNYIKYQNDIMAWGSLMNPSWDHGLYFQSGQFYGLMTKLVLDNPNDMEALQ